MDTISKLIILLIIITLFSIEFILSAAVYAKPQSMFEPFEQLCSNKTERYVKGDGKESSLFLELRSNNNLQKRKYCERNITAPESHGFIVRLVMPKLKKTISRTYPTNGQSKFRNMMSHTKINTTKSSCPLIIYSQSDIFHKKPLWKIDPCQLESQGGNQEDPVRLFDGHLNIVWEHGEHSIESKLMITALGKGYGCNFSNKHPCLKVGDEALFCISKDLICDNIRHCPKGDEYNSDEDFDMCTKLNRPVASIDDGDFWEHLTMEIFKTFFTSDTSSSGLDVNLKNDENNNNNDKNNNDVIDKIKLQSDYNWQNSDNGKILPNDIKINNDINNDINSDVKRNSTKNTLSGDLSKYGPWGYLMLGMLMCGGALLVCGLWECCCRRNKNDTTINASTISGGIDIIEPSVRIQDSTTPPNYEELDPPPSYAILFPNQKLNDIATTSTAATSEIPTVTEIVLAIENSQNNNNNNIHNSSVTTTQISTS